MARLDAGLSDPTDIVPAGDGRGTLTQATLEFRGAAHLRLVPTADLGEAFCSRCWSEVHSEDLHCDRCGTLRHTAWVADPLSGREVGGYRLMDRIGEGGMALVYRAEDPRLGREVAVKLLRPEHTGTLTAQRFLIEAQMASRLASPHTVRVFGYGEEGELVFMVMELLRGDTIEDRIEAPGGADGAFVVELLRQIGEALHEAHASGIVHRDVKPQNVMVIDQNSRPHFKLLDFGIARAFERREDPRLTRTGFIVGTPRYMSPEQIMGRDLDGRSDLFSLGLIALELLSGRVSSGASSGRELMMERVLDDVPSARTLAPDAGVPEWLYDLVDGLLRRDADERVPTAATMVAHLERRQASEPAAMARPVEMTTCERPARSAAASGEATQLFPAPADGTLDLDLTRFISDEAADAEVDQAIESLFAPRLRRRLTSWLLVTLAAAAATLWLQGPDDLANAWQAAAEHQMRIQTARTAPADAPVATAGLRVVGSPPAASLALPGAPISQGAWGGFRVTMSHAWADQTNVVRVAVEREVDGRYKRVALSWADVRMTRGVDTMGPHVGVGSLDGARTADLRFTNLERGIYDAIGEVVSTDGEHIAFRCDVCTNEYGASCGLLACTEQAHP